MRLGVEWACGGSGVAGHTGCSGSRRVCSSTAHENIVVSPRVRQPKIWWLSTGGPPAPRGIGEGFGVRACTVHGPFTILSRQFPVHTRGSDYPPSLTHMSTKSRNERTEQVRGVPLGNAAYGCRNGDTIPSTEWSNSASLDPFLRCGGVHSVRLGRLSE